MQAAAPQGAARQGNLANETVQFSRVVHTLQDLGEGFHFQERGPVVPTHRGLDRRHGPGCPAFPQRLLCERRHAQPRMGYANQLGSVCRLLCHSIPKNSC